MQNETADITDSIEIHDATASMEFDVTIEMNDVGIDDEVIIHGKYMSTCSNTYNDCETYSELFKPFPRYFEHKAVKISQTCVENLFSMFHAPKMKFSVRKRTANTTFGV